MRRNRQGWLGLGVATVAMLAALVAAQGTRPSARTETTELAVTATTLRPVVIPEATSLDNLDERIPLHIIAAERQAAREARAAEKAREKAADAARRAQAAADAAKASRGAVRSSGSALGGGWAALRQCENGGSYTSKPSDYYRGAYQFSRSTWASVGGSGDPAAASPAEQDMRAQMLYERSGADQWPRCGRYLR